MTICEYCGCGKPWATWKCLCEPVKLWVFLLDIILSGAILYGIITLIGLAT